MKPLDHIAILGNRISKGIWAHENLKRNHTDVDPNFHLEPSTDKEKERISDLVLKFETIFASHKPEGDTQTRKLCGSSWRMERSRLVGSGVESK